MAAGIAIIELGMAVVIMRALYVKTYDLAAIAELGGAAGRNLSAITGETCPSSVLNTRLLVIIQLKHFFRMF